MLNCVIVILADLIKKDTVQYYCDKTCTAVTAEYTENHIFNHPIAIIVYRVVGEYCQRMLEFVHVQQILAFICSHSNAGHVCVFLYPYMPKIAYMYLNRIVGCMGSVRT